MKRLGIIFSLAILSVVANATLLEDAEDGFITGWTVYDSNPTGATISNVIDPEQGRVIELNGFGLKNGYMLGHWGSAGFYLDKKKLSWKMKYSEPFSIYVVIKTVDENGKKENRYLWYTATDSNRGLQPGGRYIHHGVGADAIDGTWKSFSRDLDADLKEFSPNLTISTVSAFMIRGSGMLDDIGLDTINPPATCDRTIDSVVLNRTKEIINIDEYELSEEELNYVVAPEFVKFIEETDNFTYALFQNSILDENYVLFKINCRDHTDIEMIRHSPSFEEYLGQYIGEIDGVVYYAYYDDFGTTIFLGIPEDDSPLKRLSIRARTGNDIYIVDNHFKVIEYEVGDDYNQKRVRIFDKNATLISSEMLPM